jgi:hypothetical protein
MTIESSSGAVVAGELRRGPTCQVEFPERGFGLGSQVQLAALQAKGGVFLVASLVDSERLFPGPLFGFVVVHPSAPEALEPTVESQGTTTGSPVRPGPDTTEGTGGRWPCGEALRGPRGRPGR